MGGGPPEETSILLDSVNRRFTEKLIQSLWVCNPQGSRGHTERKISAHPWAASNKNQPLVSTKKSQEYFEIIEIQFVVKKFGVNGFDFIFTVRFRPL